MERTSRDANAKLVIVATSLATFIGILDSSIVNLALHSIQGALHAGISTLQWVVDAYNLVYAAFILTGGALGDRFGRKRIFLLGTGVLGVGSLVCALAPSGTVLVVGRAISGLGAALQLSTSLAIVASTFEGTALTRAVAVWISVNGLAVGIGPPLGGVLIDTFGWPSIFYVALPFLALAGWLGAHYIGESRDPGAGQLDLTGQVAAVLALAALCIGLIEAPSWGWASRQTVAAFAFFALAAAGFIARECAASSPMLPLGIFASAPLSVAVVGAVCMTFGWYTFLFLFPLYLQLVRGYSPPRAGVELLPMSIGFFLVSAFLTAKLVTRFGPRLVVGVGMSIVVVGLFGASGVTLDTSFAATALQLLGMGVGFALTAGTLSNVAVAEAPAEHAGIASGLLNAGRMLGATLGVAIVGTMLGERRGVSIAPSTIAQGMRPVLIVAACVEAAGAVLAIAVLRRDSLTKRPASVSRRAAA